MWLVLLIIFREFMVTSVRLVAADSRVVVAANNWGKAKTVSQIIAILFVLFFQYLLELVSLGILPAFTVFGGRRRSGLLCLGTCFCGSPRFSR